MHSPLPCPKFGDFSKSSFVTQLFDVDVLPPELDFILCSSLARCSADNLSSIPGGIGISPAILCVTVVSQRPGLTFKGCNFASVWSTGDGCEFEVRVCPSRLMIKTRSTEAAITIARDQVVKVFISSPCAVLRHLLRAGGAPVKGNTHESSLTPESLSIELHTTIADMGFGGCYDSSRIAGDG